MKEVQVPGVLNRNSKIRDEHLRRNYGKYFQYTEKLVPAIGEVYDIDYNRPLYSITDNQQLLEYTHNNNQKYGDSINRKYFNKNREKDIYSVKELNFDQIQAWGGNYTDYISYLDEVLGEDIYSRHVRYINDFLSGQYMENALRQTEVGVVRNINIPVAKQGIITTNPNNLKGLDTPLGTITNFMYSTLLYNGAIFNSDRKSEDKYITRSLINQYGNNLSNVTKLGDMLRVGVGDYELRDDLGADARIIHSFKDEVGDLNIHWMTKNIENAKKYLEEFNEGFSGYELGKDGYIKYVEGKENVIDLSDFKSQNHFISLYKPSTDKTYSIYNENDNAEQGYTDTPTNEDEAAWENYKKIDGSDENSKSILSRTAKLFNEHKINTLVGRFHTSVDGGISTEQEFIDTAKSKYGNSHGRNLLTRKAQDSEVADTDDTNGYDNPYCRTWTYHHQYNQVKKLIRPFITVDKNGEAKAKTIEEVQNTSAKYRSRDSKNKLIGPKYLNNNTVLNKNGFVNIAPNKGEIKEGTEFAKISDVMVHKCMFSIENLAWKDVPKFTKENYISKEQTGPNGGRIMWFPPYDLSFSENVNVAWNESTFIGRGEKVYTYTNTDRTGTLSFTLLIDHPSIVNTFAKLGDGDLSSDIDSDILRYFAGCEIPEIKVPEPKGKPKEEPKPKPKPIHGKFHFYVYFPNNYSGIVSKAKKKLDTHNDIIENDNDWWLYILIGNNCSVREDKNFWVGYETTREYGITRIFANDHEEHTEEEVEEIKESFQKEWIGVEDCWWNQKGNCIGKEPPTAYDQNDAEKVIKTGDGAGDWCWRYRPDKDLRQKLGKNKNNPQLLSFRDENSAQLNTLLTNYQGGADYTFGEVVAALIMLKKINNEIGINQDDLLEFLKEQGCDEYRINALYKLLSTEGITYDNIDVKGSADQNDPNNADMLACRRAISINNLLESSEIKAKKFTHDGRKSSDKPKDIAGDIENKLNRFSFVTVEYTLPGVIQKESDMSDKATNKKEKTYEEEVEDDKKYDEWYKALYDSSTIIKEYQEIFDNEDYEKDYDYGDRPGGVFKEITMRDWCVDNSVSYEDPGSIDTELINRIVNENRYIYFVPGEKMSNYNDDFIKHLNKHKPVDYNTSIDQEISQVNNELVELTKDVEDCGKKLSGLTEVLEELQEKRSKEKEGKTLEQRIEECKEKISCYTYGACKTSEGGVVDCESGTTQYKSEIQRIDYDLNHWASTSGDKRELVNEKKRCEKEKSKLENKIIKEEANRDKYQQELDDIDEQISGVTEEIERYYDKKHKDWEQIPTLQVELSNLRNQKALGKGLEVNKVKSELYFERLLFANASSDEKLLNSLKGQKQDGSSTDFNYFKFDNPESPGSIGEETNLFETAITTSIPGEFPYEGYTGDKSFIDPSIPSDIKMSYNLLLKEYLLLKLLIERVETGFEFACDYLMNQDETKTDKEEYDAQKDNVSDYIQLKDLLFIQYLLSSKKSTEEYYEQGQTLPRWCVSTEDHENEQHNIVLGIISYYDAWEYMIENRKNLSITYKPFVSALDEVSSAIIEYRNSYGGEVSGKYSNAKFKKMIKIIEDNTSNILKYCETVIDDIMNNNVIPYAKSVAEDEEKILRKKAEDKRAQRMAKKYKAECDTLKELKDSAEKKKDQYLYSVFVGSGITRYETEGEYFQKLDIEHPLIFKSIKEKFKYFNPAFHSMSPEGFNARLNFLHQCTRQGHTYEAKSSNGVSTAHNLAFGRMPVCVLRIGDFINTRIIINNVNINYDNGGMQWDLNPEGIGVQPMYAKVNLGITIIGGQSLNGPISRLQNAVSFDYYANTGVYDDRADRVHRNGETGELDYDYVFSIEPHGDKLDYTLYRTPGDNNNDPINKSKKYKEESDEAQKMLDSYNLTEGNNQCEK